MASAKDFFALASTRILVRSFSLSVRLSLTFTNGYFCSKREIIVLASSRFIEAQPTSSPPFLAPSLNTSLLAPRPHTAAPPHTTAHTTTTPPCPTRPPTHP